MGAKGLIPGPGGSQQDSAQPPACTLLNYVNIIPLDTIHKGKSQRITDDMSYPSSFLMAAGVTQTHSRAGLCQEGLFSVALGLNTHLDRSFHSYFSCFWSLFYSVNAKWMSPTLSSNPSINLILFLPSYFNTPNLFLVLSPF